MRARVSGLAPDRGRGTTDLVGATSMTFEVAEKWGFGMAPPKPQMARERQTAAIVVLEALSRREALPGLVDALSITKGLFNRIWRQDQWDWFIVCGELGYPSSGVAQVIGRELGELRSSVKGGAVPDLVFEPLRRLPTRKCLSVYLGRTAIAEEPGAGWIYLLSNREWPDLVKVGLTTRTVEERVKEINAATGVPIPYGVRRCWRVSKPKLAEEIAHGSLSAFRVRSDREFFRVPYGEACRLIGSAFRAHDLELRTLDHLASLGM